MTQGKPLSVNLNIVNNGTTPFVGKYDISLYNLDGTNAQTIQTIDETQGLPSGYTYVSPYLTFATSSVTVEPGTYLLALQHKPTNTDWELTGSDNFQNPISVIVAAPAIQPDAFEVNDVVGKAFNLSVSFSGLTSTIVTTGSNCHTGSDYDYYKINLPEGADYTIKSRIHDEYNSGNGKTYDVDAVLSYSFDGNKWSEAYDDIISEDIKLKNGGLIYFHIAPYFSGDIGTYLLDLNISKTIITSVNEETLTANEIMLSPNPASKSVLLDLSKFNGSVSEVAIVNLQGSLLYTLSYESSKKIEFPIYGIPDGMYLLQLKSDKGLINKKIIVQR